jgi:hypothetical protein
VVRRNSRVRSSQRTTLAHWLISTGQVAIALDPLRVHRVDDRFRGGAHHQRLVQQLPAAVRHHRRLRANPSTCSASRDRKLCGMNSGK